MFLSLSIFSLQKPVTDNICRMVCFASKYLFSVIFVCERGVCTVRFCAVATKNKSQILILTITLGNPREWSIHIYNHMHTRYIHNHRNLYNCAECWSWQKGIMVQHTPVFGRHNSVPSPPSPNPCTLPSQKGIRHILLQLQLPKNTSFKRIIKGKIQRWVWNFSSLKMFAEYRSLFLNPEQAAEDGVETHNQNHVDVGFLYEIDHVHLPPRTPFHLSSIRVAMVIEKLIHICFYFWFSKSSANALSFLYFYIMNI